MNHFSRILVISMNYFGDILMTLPLCTSIKKAWPHARVAYCIGNKGAGITGLTEGVDLWIFRGKKDSFFSKNRLIREIRSFAPDTVILIRQSPYTEALAAAASPKRILGHSDISEGIKQHVTEKSLSFAKVLGIPPIKEVLFKKELLAVEGEAIPVLFFPGTTRPSKMWPIDHWLQLGERLWKEKGILPVFAGSRSDMPLSKSLKRAKFPYKDLIGKTSLKELTALLERTEAIVTVDNGAMHLADFLHKKVIALFGSTDPFLVGPVHKEAETIGPRGECIKCGKKRCMRPRSYCMAQLTVDEVQNTLFQALENRCH